MRTWKSASTAHEVKKTSASDYVSAHVRVAITQRKDERFPEMES